MFIETIRYRLLYYIISQFPAKQKGALYISGTSLNRQGSTLIHVHQQTSFRS